MISKYHCKTPSEWAKIIIDIYDKYKNNLYDIKENIDNCIKISVLKLDWKNKQTYALINNFVSNKLKSIENELQRNILNISSLLQKKSFYYKSELQKYGFISDVIMAKSIYYKQDLDFMKYKIDNWISNQLVNIRQKLWEYYKIIQQHNYNTVLKKWYSLTLDLKTKKVINKLDIWWNYLLKNDYWDYEIEVLR
jgi:exonuclease VII large subunit